MIPTAIQRSLLQTDLGLLHPTAAQVVQLDYLLGMAAAAIAREGVRLSADAPEDDMLLAMYAAWIYRKRSQAPEATAMPRMIRAELNDRKVSKAREAAGNVV